MRRQEITTREIDKNSLENSSEDTPEQKNRDRKSNIFLVPFDHIWHNLVFELKTKTNIISAGYTSLLLPTNCR